MPELKPCKCGHEYSYTGFTNGGYYRFCDSLRCDNKTELCETVQQAIDAWNSQAKEGI